MLSSGFFSLRLFLFVALTVFILSVSLIVFHTGPLKIPSRFLQQLKEFGSDRFQLVTFGSLVKNSSVPTSISYSPPAYLGCDDTTMGLFCSISVISLPRRTDRREDMEKVRRSLALNWTYVDATSSDNSMIQTIMRQVRQLRENPALEKDFVWPAELRTDPTSSLDLQGSDLWTSSSALRSATSSEALISTKSSDRLSPEKPSSSDGFNASRSGLLLSQPLTCATQNHALGLPYAPSLPPYMLLTSARVACWYSHLQLIRTVAMNVGTGSRCGDSTLILEDDVDMERDVTERLRGLWPALPPRWDIVFLGHCWSNETRYPPIANITLPGSSLQTFIHPSHAPKCTHAYALSRSGGLKLLNYLRHPPFAYSRALDQALSWLVLTGKLKSFSVVPSVVIQRKVGRSDVDEGRDGFGSTWKDELADGILSP